MARIKLQNVTKQFGDVTAVDGIDLEMRDGEFVVIVGPSGCGKSTTLRLVAGLESVSDGQIDIGGRDVTALDGAERDVSMVFQNYALFPHMTARRNITYGITASNDFDSDEIDRRVAEAADALDIDDLLDRKPSALSGGEKQRVAIGRTLVRDPTVFLMDEPLSNLDAKLRVQMRAELREIHRDIQTTTVYVTHDQEEAMTLADRVVVMEDSEIQQVDPPQDLYDYPENRFVATFIGSPSMNILEVALKERDGQYVVTHPSFTVPLHTKSPLDTIAGDTVEFGVRPRDISIVETPSENSLPIEVSVTENLGDELLIRGTLDGQSVRIRSENPRQQLDVGERIHVTCDPDRIHLFDNETGEAVYHSEPTGEQSTDAVDTGSAASGGHESAERAESAVGGVDR